MYQPAHFEETQTELMHALMQAHPFGALVLARDGQPDADHLPFEIGAPSAEAPHGILRAHIARANPLAGAAPGSAAMVIFQGPHGYVTPAWYAEKPLSGKVVPTYDYAVVHAHGPLRLIDDAAWLHGLLTRLTARHEAGRAQPWALADAPPDYVARMLKAIVGIEIPITRLSGKWKVSQNRPGDRARIAAGLADEGLAALAELVRAR